MQKGKFRRFQVYGQRCSGTNAVIKLLEQNFEELQFTEEYGFKHWLVSPEITIPDDVFVIVIARRVDHWLRSLYATPWHVHPDLKAMTFGQFIRAEWRTVWDQDFWGIDREHPKFGSPILEELCPESGGPFANAIAMRTAKLRNLDSRRVARTQPSLGQSRRVSGGSGRLNFTHWLRFENQH